MMSEYCKRDLQWWYDAIQQWNGAPLLIKEPEVQIETDTSGTGWTGVLKTELRGFTSLG